MEIIAVLVMIAAGGALAIFALVAYTLSRSERERSEARAASRDEVASSLLHHVLVAGGASPDQALRDVRRQAGLGGKVTRGIDVASWAESYARAASVEQRTMLLETAVRLVAQRGRPVPLLQYSALLDLSFGLGFHTDALARMREEYRFEYVDHAKNARPRDADRAGGATPLFVRDPARREEWLRVLEIEGSPDRQKIISAYRRLAARHHPDKVGDRSAAAQEEAAARFIEITRAYEQLLAIYRD
ncbi:MAG TPA: J domain-containing protein [Thermoanaerobaculia bacterium]|nr:J domain-containing protein [Thermoanaerobaculia bacterium]